jgi:hypothetical protein
MQLSYWPVHQPTSPEMQRANDKIVGEATRRVASSNVANW